MSDVTKEHPEFFKAPSERDAVGDIGPESEIDDAPGSDAGNLEPRETHGETVDELLGNVVVPASVWGLSRLGKSHDHKAAGLIALLGGVIFALLYAAAVFGLMTLRQGPDAVTSSTISFLTTPIYWLTTALFTGLFALLTVLLSRASWIPYVVASFFVALLTYAAAIGAGLIAIHAWELTFTAAQNAVWEGIAFSPLILIAPIIGREIFLWLGLWISLRAKRLRAESLRAESLRTGSLRAEETPVVADSQ